MKNVNGIKPSYVEVWEYLCKRISSNAFSSIHPILKIAKIIFSYKNLRLFYEGLQDNNIY